MHGHIADDGTVTITFNSQYERLETPTPGTHWLPCSECGKLFAVRFNVVSITCENCFNEYREGNRDFRNSPYDYLRD